MAYTKFTFDDDPQPPAQDSIKQTTPKTAPIPTAVLAETEKQKAFKVVDFQASDEEIDLPFPLGGGNSTSTSSNKRKRQESAHLDIDASGFETVGKKGKTLSKRDHGEGKRLREERERLAKERAELPIWSGQEAIQKAVKENDTVVILGETGSGKTTQVPQFLLTLFPNTPSTPRPPRIAVTQPRRVAALSLATRVAAEQGTKVGQRVGHSVRFDTVVGPATRLVYCTDGMLVRELLGDPMLSQYSAIIIDEAHERNISTDILLGSLREIQKIRNAPGATDDSGNPQVPLKVIVMSATLDAERFSTFFNHCPILYVRGRQHPVKIYHTEEDSDQYEDLAVRTFFQIHTARPDGDVLIFLSGQEDIDNLAQQIKFLSNQLERHYQNVLVLPFMASTSPLDQARVFQPAPARTRKVILATNVAETSITIPGIKYVIDTGVCKEKNYLSRRGTGIETLSLKLVSQSAAQQRTGRAGREGPGFCYRLYTSQTYKKMSAAPLPEILRTNLSSVVLQLKEIGVDDVQSFGFLDMPHPDFITESLMTLYGLGALDKTLHLTPTGSRMLKFPLDPAQARIVLASIDRSCTLDILDILALANETPIFTDPIDKRAESAEARASFRHRDGDHLTMLNVLRSYEALPKSDSAGRKLWCRDRFVNERNLKRAIQARDQMREICVRENVDWKTTAGDDSEPILRSLLDGLFMNTAIERDGEYKQMVGNSIVKIHPSSTMFGRRANAILYGEIVHTSNTYARSVSQVQYAWLAELPMFSFAGAGLE
ncbi:p-loop containing nucleoside triphosphate hydrolase protein [Phaffia rhodozyma]|uniref:RNA helicase n=1 Tax=Phaffia rhodozyma TaxID=264483 RepID=A0A0F7SGI6_PHARH|nr:p-loop containing nucleoside triphosphate hydrolase protein [Phaffia rhodozyma]